MYSTYPILTSTTKVLSDHNPFGLMSQGKALHVWQQLQVKLTR